MNKEELVLEISKKAGITQKDTSLIISEFMNAVEKAVAKGNRVTLVGFGTFEPRDRAERTGRNPQNGKAITIPAKTVPVFVAGRKFKATVGSGK